MALLIGGSNGSGKSLFCEICNSHPDVRITDELRAFLKINATFFQHIGSLHIKWRDCINIRRCKRNDLKIRYLVLVGLRTILSNRVSVSDIEKVLKCLFPHASIVGDAFSPYVSNLDKTVSIPGLKHVAVYRDCRDVTATIKQRLKGSWYTPKFAAQRLGTTEKIAQDWLRHIQIMEKHKESIYMVCHEDLLSDPQKVLTPFAHWLCIDPQYFRYDFIHTGFANEYKRVLTAKDLDTIRAIAGPTMERLGYI